MALSAVSDSRTVMAATKEKIVFVIGAGASVDVGFPDGKGLTKKIANAIGFQNGSGDDDLRNCVGLFQKAPDAGDGGGSYIDACARIASGMAQAESIDYFLHENRGDKKLERCAKLAIAKIILDAERASPLNVDPRQGKALNFGALSANWHGHLFDLLKRGHRWFELTPRLERVSLIIFNYDRCVEHYLFHAFRHYYKLSDNQAGELVATLKIFHPYGTVGFLPWQNAQVPQSAFGERQYLSNLDERAAEIRTFTEGQKADDTEQLRRRIAEAHVIVFLGFGFHELNMELLRPDRWKQTGDVRNKRMFATGLKLHRYQQQVAVARMCSLAPSTSDGDVIIDDATCAQLFDRYSQGFSLGP
jgi:hypothetical protein